MITVQLTGVDQVSQRLQRFQEPWAHVLAEALWWEGDRILGQSAQLVPVLTGNLKGTAHETRPQWEGAVLAVELSYGGNGQAPYAAKQHFDVRLKHPHGGQAHYLQQPFFAASATFAQHMADAIRPALGMA